MWCASFLVRHPSSEEADLGIDWEVALADISRWEPQQLHDLQLKAASIAKARQREASKQGHAGFLDWLVTALKGGAGQAHKWTKKAQEPQCPLDEALGQGTDAWDLIGYMEFRAAPWAKRWQRDIEQLDLLLEDLQGLRTTAKNKEAPDITLQQVDGANVLFKKNTSTSTDSWHPREVKQLPPVARRALGSVLGESHEDPASRCRLSWSKLLCWSSLPVGAGPSACRPMSSGHGRPRAWTPPMSGTAPS